MKHAIWNVRIVTAEMVIENGAIVFENGIITYVGEGKPAADTVTDGEGKYLIPGFVDIHCHGASGNAFNDAQTEKNHAIAAFHLSHGTTTMLASTSTASLSDLEKALCCLSLDMENGLLPNVAGLFMEGPWLSTASAGAQAASLMRAPSVQDVYDLKGKYPAILRLGVAPEEKGGMEMGRAGSEKGILMSMAHTAATFAQTEQAFQNGYTLLTHFYCAMKGVERKNAYRIAGAVEAGFYLDDMFVE